MNTYRIERVNGKFEVAMYTRRWFSERRTVVHILERLDMAEEIFTGAIGEAYARKLDEDRYVPVSATIADCEPRTQEEHIYTAIVLANGKPPGRNEVISENIHELAERMCDVRMSRIEKRLFLHRFMTWYARHNPDYEDPRLNSHNDYGNDYRAGFAPIVSPPAAPSQSMMRAMLNGLRSFTGRKR